MNRKQKVLSYILCLLMVITLVAPMTAEVYASTALTKKSLYIGQTFKLRVSGASSKAKITYESSKPKIAQVSKKTGKVRALKKGVAIITAKITTKKKVKYLKCTVTVRKCVHVYDAKITIKPTCHNMGQEIYTCKICGLKKVRALEMTPHDYKLAEVIKPATCKDEGKGWYECKECKKRVKGVIAKSDVHTWNAGKITTKATCTTEGVKTYTCIVCGATKEEAIPVDPKAHKWNKGEVTQEGDCTHPKITTYTCEECGATKTEVDKLAGHKWTAKETPASLTEQGYTTYTCSVCKETYKGDYKWYVPEDSVASSPTGVRNQNGLKEGNTFSPTSAYTWKGGNGSGFIKTGVGAVAFAYTCSDAMFGIDPAYKVQGYNKLRAGDIVFTTDGNCYFVQAVTGTDAYVAGVTTVGSNLVVKWDQAIPLNSVSYYLSRWYKY